MTARLWIPAALALVACGGPAEPPSPASTAAAATPSAEPSALFFLVPETTPALVGRAARFGLERGDLRDARPVGELRDRFDPFVARVGGTQHNGVVADVVDGRAGATHVFGEPGDALVGFSTEPRLVAWPAGDGGSEPVLLSQHVKCLLFVSRGGRDLPQPSAALSARIGLQLEIVPMMDPLPLLEGEWLPLRVRFDGPALAGATVVVQRAPRGGGPVVEHLRAVTDDVGSVLMPVGGPGRYLVTVVHEPDPSRSPREVHRAALTFDVGAKR